MDPDRTLGLDKLSQEAVELKFLSAPLRPEQVATLVQNMRAEQPLRPIRTAAPP